MTQLLDVSEWPLMQVITDLDERGLGAAGDVRIQPNTYWTRTLDGSPQYRVQVAVTWTAPDGLADSWILPTRSGADPKPWKAKKAAYKERRDLLNAADAMVRIIRTYGDWRESQRGGMRAV